MCGFVEMAAAGTDLFVTGAVSCYGGIGRRRRRIGHAMATALCALLSLMIGVVAPRLSSLVEWDDGHGMS